MNKRVMFLSFAMGVLALPAVALGESAGGHSLNSSAKSLLGLIQLATYAVYALAFLAFFWSLATLLFTKNEDKSKNATHTLIISVVVIFVMTSIWGIVRLLQNTVGANDNSVNDVVIPGLDFGKPKSH